MPFITQGKTNIKYILIVVVLAAIVSGGILGYQYWWAPKEEAKNIQKPVGCTQEAKVCPDGSAVGRTGPNCEFAQCPDVKKDETIQKQEVEQVHIQNLGNYLAGDAENFSQAFSENYIDWGSGPVDMNKELLEEMFSKEIFKQLKDKTPEEVVDLDNKIVLGYSEILESEVYESYEGRHGFHFQEGDVFIYFPAGLIPDGFSGVYRKENGVWKIIIAD